MSDSRFQQDQPNEQRQQDYRHHVDQPAVRPRRRGDYFPGLLAIAIIGLCILAIVLAQVTGLRGDRSEVNLLTFGGAAISILTLVIWFVFRSHYARRLRYGFLAFLAVAFTALALTVRVDQVSGEMVPIFRFVWQVPSD